MEKKKNTKIKKMIGDERFAEINWHPKFRRPPRTVRKVKIDKRFEPMFVDPKFKLKHSSVDKRGRPGAAKTSSEDLRRYYDISSSESDSESESGDDNNEIDKKIRRSSPKLRKKAKEHDDDERKKAKKKKKISLEEEEEEQEEDEVDDEEEEIKIDLARGEGNISTTDSGSGSESGSEWDFEEDAEQVVEEWDDLLEPSRAPVAEKATSRLALCNMDWEKITARDILILLNSFKPSSGVLKSVKIYPSEFGRMRMREETKNGPVELREMKMEMEMDPDPDDERSEDQEDEDEEKPFLDKSQDARRNKVLLEKLRRYELNRLKYYYAVVECDSAETAEFIYTNCDGMEYEMSGTKLDLRYIPSDMEFEESSVKDESRTVGDIVSYRPVVFVNRALQQSRPTLTWEEERAGDPRRAEITKRAFADPSQWDTLDLDRVLASPSSGSGSGSDQDPEEDEKREREEEEEEEEIISKKKKKIGAVKTALDLEIGDEEKDDVEMEIKWDPEEEGEGKTGGDKKNTPTQWQKYLERRKEKRRRRKEEIRRRRVDLKRRRNGGGAEEEDSSSASSEEQEEEEERAETGKKAKKPSKQAEQESEEWKKNREAEGLELLLAESDDEEAKRRHFNLKKLLLVSQKGRRKLNEDEEEMDEFSMNIADPRFGAIFTSHLYNVDPSDPAYKKTAGMEKLIKEKSGKKLEKKQIPQKNAAEHQEEMKNEETIKTKISPAVGEEDVNLLAKKVKAKAQFLKRQKQTTERKRKIGKKN